jgi:hypothetical protein
MKFKWFLIVLIKLSIVSFLLFIHGTAAAQVDESIVAPAGCAMAHCCQGMSDNVYLPPPISASRAFRDTSVAGSGLGCVSNGEMAVCSFRPTRSRPIGIKAYGSKGESLWSYSGLQMDAWYSAPMIGQDGDVIAADSRIILRFNNNGKILWTQPTAGGNPISPNVTDDGKIVLATMNGPISAYDYNTGRYIASIRLDERQFVNFRWRSGYFDTINTCAVKGNRIYVSTRFTHGFIPTNIGRLYALDLNDEGFSIAWYYEFRAPSGTSPTLGTIEKDGETRTVIYFDGDAQALAVKDMDSYGDLLWSYPLGSGPESSPAIDPRGGIWYFGFGDSRLLRIDRESGNLLEEIDMGVILGESGIYIPISIMTIAGDADSPVMIVTGTNSGYSRTFVTAITLDEKGNELLWKYRVDGFLGFGDVPSGQFAIINSYENPDESVVVFGTNANGVWGLAGPVGQK